MQTKSHSQIIHEMLENQRQNISQEVGKELTPYEYAQWLAKKKEAQLNKDNQDCGKRKTIRRKI